MRARRRGGSGSSRLNRRRPAIALATLVAVAAGVWTLDRALPPDMTRLQAHGTEYLDRQGRLLALRPAPGGVWRLPTRVQDVDPAFVERLLATEDRSFWHHPGVNPLALVRAALQDLRAGRIVSGGSTLTMQVARLLTPRPRTLRAKLIETLRAMQLEARYSKAEILGMWLTLAPYGGNIEGVRAASLTWFGKLPNALDPPQQTLLVAIPRRPEALRPDRHAQSARLIRDRLLLADGGAIPDRRQPMPRHALLSLPVVEAPVMTTTLDLGLQVELETVAADRIAMLPDRASIAMIVADLATREIRAIVSGSDTNASRAGGLDLTRAVRSPGSALKPFIYAMAFEAGHAGPETTLDDLPRRFGSYAPENFDRGFTGPVSMADALRRSLNLPAVALLSQVGPAQFLARLNSAGIMLRLPNRAIGTADPSLPLALGGVGTSLRDVAALYAGLAQNGEVTPLRLACCAVPGRMLVSRHSAAAIDAILTQPFPDGGPTGVAWKTGTSWGGRDAWAFGFDARHVAGVWVGRPDSTPLPGATGRGQALPILSRSFTALPPAPRRAPEALEPSRATLVAHPRSDALRMLFPPSGSTLSSDGPITLRAMGGRRPLVFLVDGAHLAHDPARREASWLPAGAGFFYLTVLDADGQAAHGAVRVR